MQGGGDYVALQKEARRYARLYESKVKESDTPMDSIDNREARVKAIQRMTERNNNPTTPREAAHMLSRFISCNDVHALYLIDKEIEDFTHSGKKDDHEKPMWDLLPMEQVESIVKVLTFGAKKYGPENWKTVANAEKRYFSALMRHLTAWQSGKRTDPESGQSHLAHAGCCLLFLMWLENDRTRRSIEDNIEKIGKDPTL